MTASDLRFIPRTCSNLSCTVAELKKKNMQIFQSGKIHSTKEPLSGILTFSGRLWTARYGRCVLEQLVFLPRRQNHSWEFKTFFRWQWNATGRDDSERLSADRPLTPPSHKSLKATKPVKSQTVGFKIKKKHPQTQLYKIQWLFYMHIFFYFIFALSD